MDPELRHRVLVALGVVEPVAPVLRPILRHLPGLHDQKTHGGKGGRIKAVVKKVAEALDTEKPKPRVRNTTNTGKLPGPGRDISARDADAWGRASFTRLADLSPTEREALHLWSGGAYGNVNKLLRGENVGPSNRSAAQEVVAGLDRVMESQQVPEDVVVARGVGLDAFGGDPAAMVGKVVRSRGFLPTSVGSKVRGVHTRHPVHMVIEVPKGTPGYYMGEAAKAHGYREEKELLLNRDLEVAVMSARKDPRTGRWTVTAKVVAH